MAAAESRSGSLWIAVSALVLVVAVFALMWDARPRAGAPEAASIEGAEEEPQRSPEDLDVQRRSEPVERPSTSEPAVGAPLAVEDGVLVRVRAAAGEAPIAGARVFVIDAEPASGGSAITDAAGCCRVLWPDGMESVRVMARAEGYADRGVELPKKRPEVVDLRLDAACVLRGRVVRFDGMELSPLSSVRVYAWNRVDAPRPRDFDLADEGVPLMLSGAASVEGEFELHGASASSRYTVAAGGSGWTVRELTKQVDACAAPIELRLERLFGLVLRAKLADGNACPPSRLGTVTHRDQLSPAPESLELIDARASAAGIRQLEGIPIRGWDWRATPLLYVAPQDGGRLGPIGRTYRIPGFETQEVDVDLPAIDRGVPAHDVVFTPNAFGLGTLKLRFEGALPISAAEASGLWLSPHRIALQAARGVGESFEIDLENPGCGVLTVESVPQGHYHFMLLLGGYRVFPSEPEGRAVFIGAEPVEISVPAEKLGAIRLLPEDCDPEHRGSLFDVFSRRAPGEHRARFVFDRAPYLLSGLLPGSYELEIRAARSDGTEQMARLTEIEVKAGTLVERAFAW